MVNQYLAWAYNGVAGVNVYGPTAWAALGARSLGVVNGIGDPLQANTAWRQSTVGVAALAQFAVDASGGSALDDGSVPNFQALLQLGLTAYIKTTIAAGVVARSNKTTATISSGVVNINFSLGNYFVVLMNAAITDITFSNFPPSGIEQEVTVDFVADGTAHGVTGLGAAILKWLGQAGAGTAPTFTFTTGYENTCVFKARDGVTTRVAAVFSGTAAA